MVSETSVVREVPLLLRPGSKRGHRQHEAVASTCIAVVLLFAGVVGVRSWV